MADATAVRDIPAESMRSRFRFRFAGAKMRWMAIIMVLLQPLGWAENPRPVWTLNLEQRYGLRSFQTQINLTWSKQQNVVFLTSGRLLLYQVNQLAEPARLAARNASGGAGNFFLEIRVLDVRKGNLIQSLRLPASADFSAILPAQNGRLIVRTGETLRLCTQEFRTLASRELPLKGEAPVELWQIAVSPSGAQLALVHEQATPSPAVVTDEKAISEIEILDAETLKTVRKFSMSSRLSPWSAGDGFLVAADPGQLTGERRWGYLDFEGNWKALAVKGESCNYHMRALVFESMAVYGCGRLAVLNAEGKKLFAHDLRSHDTVGSVSRAGRYLAVELDRQMAIDLPGTNFPFTMPKPDRLELYDLETNKRLLSLAVKSNNLYYAVSDNGALAVIEDSTLALYRADN